MPEQNQEKITPISPIDQFRELLKANKEKKKNLYETLNILNEKSNYNSHLTIGGCFISPDSVTKVIWATIEIDVLSSIEIKENKDDRMCPIATHMEQLIPVQKFHQPIFDDNNSNEDTWKNFVEKQKILPVSTVVDRCINTQKQDNIQPVINAEYFIVIFPSCTDIEKSSLFDWLLYKQGRAIFFEPITDEEKNSLYYIVRHPTLDEKNNNPKVEDFWNNYDTKFKDYSFNNFVDWIIESYNGQPEVKKTVVFYVGYSFSDYEDARLWTAFTDDIKEDDLYAAESLLYRLHQKQIDGLMRETLIKHPIADLWSEERKDWFINSNENENNIVITHNLPTNKADINNVKEEIEKLLQKYININSIPEEWLKQQLGRVHETLKVLCGKCSITQGNIDEKMYSQKAVSLNALFLVSALAIGQKTNESSLLKNIFKDIEFLDKDTSVTEVKAFYSPDGQKLITSFFDLIQNLCIDDENTTTWQLSKIELKSSSLKFTFDPFNMKKVKSGRGQSLLQAILKRDRMGTVTGAYFDFIENISKVQVADTVYYKSKCVVNFYPSSDFQKAYLEINPIRPSTNLLIGSNEAEN